MGKSENEDRKIAIAKDLGKNLYKIRKERGFTREELAEKSNLSANYIYGLENGTYLPGCIALIDLANALNITTSQLLDKFLDNSRENMNENIFKRINSLSNRDLNLIICILDFLSKNE